MECHIILVSAAWHPAISETLLQPVFSRALLVWPRNVFTMLRKCRKIQCPDSGSWVLRENLEVSHLWVYTVCDTYRPDNTLSVDALPSWMEYNFPSFLCAQSHTLLENACWKPFFSSNFSWCCDLREDRHTHRERQRNIHRSAQSRFLHRSDPFYLTLSRILVDTAPTHSMFETGYQTLAEKLAFFSQLALKQFDLVTVWKCIWFLFSYIWQW